MAEVTTSLKTRRLPLDADPATWIPALEWRRRQFRRSLWLMPVLVVVLVAMGVGGKAGPVAAILIGGVVCCAAAIGGDNLQDLKCGQLVGSTPWKQQVMQILGVVVASLTMAPILNFLNEAYVIGSAKLPAPQANLMGSVAKGVFEGGLPWNIVAGLGAPTLAIVVWALFVSPRAMLAVHPFVRAIVELFVYAVATIAWWSMGQAWIGLGFAIVAVTVGAVNGRRRLW